MRRLDSLELERAIEELRHAIAEGRLSKEEAAPVIAEFHRLEIGEEAAILFEESCLSRARSITITVVDEFPPKDEEADWLPFGDDE